MKRILSILLTIFLYLSCSMPCFALYYDQRDHDVSAKYHLYSNAGVYTTPPIAGEYPIATDDGVEITVTSPHLDLILVVHRISPENKEFYAWFLDCISNQEIENPIPYDIYFLTSLGERIELSEQDEVGVRDARDNPAVWKLSYSGTVNSVPSSKKSNTLFFKADGIGGYYILGELPEEEPPPGSGEETFPQPGEGTLPETGVLFSLEIWLLIIIASGLFIWIMLLCKKKKNIEK